jgi:hypothetical protein
MPQPEHEKIFEYLSEVKRRGTLNMYSASPLIAVKFNLPVDEARCILLEWLYQTTC